MGRYWVWGQNCLQKHLLRSAVSQKETWPAAKRLCSRAEGGHTLWNVASVKTKTALLRHLKHWNKNGFMKFKNGRSTNSKLLSYFMLWEFKYE